MKIRRRWQILRRDNPRQLFPGRLTGEEQTDSGKSKVHRRRLRSLRH
jgi:hypothetical protein